MFLLFFMAGTFPDFIAGFNQFGKHVDLIFALIIAKDRSKGIFA